jgi:hypothetical protein
MRHAGDVFFPSATNIKNTPLTTMARSPMMNLFLTLVVVVVAAVLMASTSTQAFVPSSIRPATSMTTMTTLHMGLFDGLKKKPADGKKEDKNKDFLAGRSPKITIRQDEDNAMWVDEPKAADKKKGTPPKKGK